MESQKDFICMIALTANERRVMNRHVKAGNLVSPLPNLFAETVWWKGLNAKQQAQCIARAWARLHPEDVLAETSAVCMVANLESSYGLYREKVLYLASTNNSHHYMYKHHDWSIQHVYMKDVPAITLENGIRITSIPRTLFDCGRRHPFVYALGIFDSADRHGMDVKGVLSFPCRDADEAFKIQQLLRYRDPRSENGGESYVRGVIIGLGFIVPHLQVEFPNPNSQDFPLRVDYLWELPDGTKVAMEFDGMAKFGKSRMEMQRYFAKNRERDRILTNEGVNTIIHVSYEDALDKGFIYNALRDAKIPFRHEDATMYGYA